MLDLQNRIIIQNRCNLSTFAFVKIEKRKDYEKIVILLSAMLFMVACEKGNEEVKEAKVVVSVYDENGKIITGVPVKMYNEKGL